MISCHFPSLSYSAVVPARRHCATRSPSTTISWCLPPHMLPPGGDACTRDQAPPARPGLLVLLASIHRSPAESPAPRPRPCQLLLRHRRSASRPPFGPAPRSCPFTHSVLGLSWVPLPPLPLLTSAIAPTPLTTDPAASAATAAQPLLSFQLSRGACHPQPPPRGGGGIEVPAPVIGHPLPVLVRLPGAAAALPPSSRPRPAPAAAGRCRSLGPSPAPFHPRRPARRARPLSSICYHPRRGCHGPHDPPLRKSLRGPTCQEQAKPTSCPCSLTTLPVQHQAP